MKDRKMERYHLYVTSRQKKLLKSKSKEIGISCAELIRRVLDKYIDQKEREGKNGK